MRKSWNLLPHRSAAPSDGRLGYHKTGRSGTHVHTSLNRLDWLAGKGYDYIGFFIHRFQFVKKNASTVNDTFLAVMLENLPEPILTGREERGFPKLFSDIDAERSPSSYRAQASWWGSVFLKFELDGLRGGKQPQAADDSHLLLYKYIPATGEPGVADVEYPVYVPQPLCLGNVDRFQTATKASTTVEGLNEKALPSLHHVARGVARIPVYDIVEASIVEGVLCWITFWEHIEQSRVVSQLKPSTKGFGQILQGGVQSHHGDALKRVGEDSSCGGR